MRMRTISKVALVVGVTAVSLFAQKVGDSMTAKRNSTQIYANEIREAYEQPIATVGSNDLLSITEVKKSHYKIRTQGGVEGYVQKNDVNKASKAAISRGFVFESAEVIGYLDNPTPVYIIDMDDPNADPITLDRSFKDALKENVDKETMERLAR